MSINEIQTKIIKSAGFTYRTLSPIFGVPEASSTSKLGRGLVRIDDLAELCEKCNAKLLIRTHDNQEIVITTKDFKKATT